METLQRDKRACEKSVLVFQVSKEMLYRVEILKDWQNEIKEWSQETVL